MIIARLEPEISRTSEVEGVNGPNQENKPEFSFSALFFWWVQSTRSICPCVTKAVWLSLRLFFRDLDSWGGGGSWYFEKSNRRNKVTLAFNVLESPLFNTSRTHQFFFRFSSNLRRVLLLSPLKRPSWKSTISKYLHFYCRKTELPVWHLAKVVDFFKQKI